MLLSFCVRPQKVEGNELIPARGTKGPSYKWGRIRVLLTAFALLNLEAGRNRVPTHTQKKKKGEKKRREREREREKPNRRKRQIHPAPSLRQVDVSAGASPMIKEEKKARTRKGKKPCVKQVDVPGASRTTKEEKKARNRKERNRVASK